MTCLSILLCGGVSLTNALSWSCVRMLVSLMWKPSEMFLGQERGLSLLDLVDRGLALDVLVDSFFLEWFRIHGRSVHRGVPCFNH